MEEKNRIVIDQKIHFGQPCIAETRIPVYCILELVQADVPFDEIVAKYYPDITVEDVKACVQYATDLVKAEEIHSAASCNRTLRISISDDQDISGKNIRRSEHRDRI
ncbi:MAG: DUF433 domain-containing protein [bacterium]